MMHVLGCGRVSSCSVIQCVRPPIRALQWRLKQCLAYLAQSRRLYYLPTNLGIKLIVTVGQQFSIAILVVDNLTMHVIP